jgi:hypothetical protein
MISQDLYDSFSENAIVRKDLTIILRSEDYDINFDVFLKDSYRLNWIRNLSKRYKGTDIFETLLKWISDRIGIAKITATGIKGKFKGIPVNGYYTMMRWGFLPEDGVDFINDTLGTTYIDERDAVCDSDFWLLWKEDGVEFEGVFDMKDNSLSYTVLHRKC